MQNLSHSAQQGDARVIARVVRFWASHRASDEDSSHDVRNLLCIATIWTFYLMTPNDETCGSPSLPFSSRQRMGSLTGQQRVSSSALPPGFQQHFSSSCSFRNLLHEQRLAKRPEVHDSCSSATTGRTGVHCDFGRRLQIYLDWLYIARGRIYFPCLIGGASKVLTLGGPTQTEIEVKECCPSRIRQR